MVGRDALMNWSEAETRQDLGAIVAFFLITYAASMGLSSAHLSSLSKQRLRPS
jgi:hypothetical protein